MTKKPFPMTVSLAAEHGTPRELLVALRGVLAAAMDDERTQPRDLSALSLRLREVSAEISKMDDLAAAGHPVAVDEPLDPSTL